MARNPNYMYNISMVDRSGEPTKFTLNTITQHDIDSLATDLSTFFTQFADVCDGTIIGVNAVASKRLSNVAHSDAGQREERWLVTYADTTTLATYQCELPCRKASVQPPVGTDDVIITAGVWADFVTAFQTVACSPDGNAVLVQKITLVGRNS